MLKLLTYPSAFSVLAWWRSGCHVQEGLHRLRKWWQGGLKNNVTRLVGDWLQNEKKHLPRVLPLALDSRQYTERIEPLLTCCRPGHTSHRLRTRRLVASASRRMA